MSDPQPCCLVTPIRLNYPNETNARFLDQANGFDNIIPQQEHVVVVGRHDAGRGATDVRVGGDAADAAPAALPGGARRGGQGQRAEGEVAPREQWVRHFLVYPLLGKALILSRVGQVHTFESGRQVKDPNPSVVKFG